MPAYSHNTCTVRDIIMLDEDQASVAAAEQDIDTKSAYKVAIGILYSMSSLFTSIPNSTNTGLSGKVYDDTENVSLQDAFSKFRDAKARERKMMKAYKVNSQGVRTEEFKQSLR